MIYVVMSFLVMSCNRQVAMDGWDGQVFPSVYDATEGRSATRSTRAVEATYVCLLVTREFGCQPEDL